MPRTWQARVSALLIVAMLGALVGVVQSNKAAAAEPVVTVGVDLRRGGIDHATYAITAFNQSTSAVNDVRLTSRIPRGARFVSSVPSPTSDSDCHNGGVGEGRGAVCRWRFDRIAPGGSRTVAMIVDLARVRRHRTVEIDAMVAAAGGALNGHTNSYLHLTRATAPATWCESDPSPSAVRAHFGARAISGGGPLERIWETRLDCSGDNPSASIAAQQASQPTCIDVDPETGTTPSSQKRRLDAIVTNGTATNRSAAGEDSCGGSPMGNVNVVWLIEDDNPDAFISDVEIFPTSGQPNQQTTVTDEGTGRTFILVRLQDQTATGENRISGRIDGTTDHAEPGSSTLCGVPIIGFPCPGQGDNEDDVLATWGGTSTASPTGSPAPTGTTTATASPTPTGTTTGSPTPTGTTTARPTGTTRPTSPGPTQSTPSGSARTLTLFSSKERVGYNTSIRLSGQVFSSNPACDDAGEIVQIRRRVHGTARFVDAEGGSTDADGRYSITLRATKSADYVAVATAHDSCTEASSTSVPVRVRVRVSVKASRISDTAARLRGTVTPTHRGKVLLQRRKGRKWVRHDSDRLAKGRYSFSVQVTWQGSRTFRVIWKKQHEDHDRGTSRRITIR